MLVLQHLRAGVDPNGNSKKLYVVYEVGEEVFCKVRHVHRGDIPAEFRGLKELPTLYITDAEYVNTLKNARERSDIKFSE